MIIYFSKMNLNSHIFEVYEHENPKKKLNYILQKVYNLIRDGLSYEETVIGQDNEGNNHEQKITYKLAQVNSMIDQSNLSIYGKLVKNSVLFVKKLEDSGEITVKPIDYDEIVDFYFDVEKEVIAYNTANRFGYVDINNAFQKIINQAFKNKLLTEKNFKSEVPIFVKMNSVKEGLSIEGLKKELKKLGRITELSLEIIPPNSPEKYTENMKENGKEYLEELKRARVTQRKVVFESRDEAGLQIDDEMINNEIELIDNIHLNLSSETAIRNGYVVVEGTKNDGTKFTTNKHKPQKAKISNNLSSTLFSKKCKDLIVNLSL